LRVYRSKKKCPPGYLPVSTLPEYYSSAVLDAANQMIGIFGVEKGREFGITRGSVGAKI